MKALSLCCFSLTLGNNEWNATSERIDPDTAHKYARVVWGVWDNRKNCCLGYFQTRAAAEAYLVAAAA